MSTKAVSDVVRRAERGARVREVREAMGLQQDAFGAELTKALEPFGLEESYNKDKVSKIETGARDLGPEEIAVIVALDPKARGMDWLVFGAASVTASRPATTPVAPDEKFRLPLEVEQHEARRGKRMVEADAKKHRTSHRKRR